MGSRSNKKTLDPGLASQDQDDWNLVVIPAKAGIQCLLLLVFALILSPAHAQSGQAFDPVLREKLIHAVNTSQSFNDRFEAEVWLLDMSTRLKRFMPDHDRRLAFLKAVHREATLAKLRPELVLALIEVESLFQRFAISSVGAQGYMQIMPFWLGEIGRSDDNLFHRDTNLRMGCTILRYYLDMEKGNMTRALARYNGSTGQYWYPNRVYRALDHHWK